MSRPSKPSALIRSHQTKADQQKRAAVEAVMTPRTPITKNPPKELQGRAARRIWRRLIGLYLKIDGTFINAFDQGVLVDYCQSEAELLELANVRREIQDLLARHIELLNNFEPSAEGLKEYANLLAGTNMLIERFTKMDGRLDGKRKMIGEFSQSLYLSPRSRGSVPPPEKQRERESELSRLLAEEKASSSVSMETGTR